MSNETWKDALWDAVSLALDEGAEYSEITAEFEDQLIVFSEID